MKAGIIGVKSQMATFEFFFALTLGQKLFSLTDNLLKALQKEKMSALSGQHLANLTQQTLAGMRNNEAYDLLWDYVAEKAAKHSFIESPLFTKKNKLPKLFHHSFYRWHQRIR